VPSGTDARPPQGGESGGRGAEAAGRTGGGWGMVTMDPERLVARKLRNAGITPNTSYSTGQVARIIGVSPETVRRLVDAYEPPEVTARDAPKNSRRRSGLRALRIVSHRRIPHDALVDWLRENAAYLRINEDTD